MLYYDRTYVTEGIDNNKTSATKECDMCNSWYFLDKRFKFQPNVCNRCHNIFMMSMNDNILSILLF